MRTLQQERRAQERGGQDYRVREVTGAKKKWRRWNTFYKT